MRIVLDTNIYVSGLIFPKGAPKQVLELAKAGEVKVYCSQFILEEIKKILSVKFDYSEEVIRVIIEELLKFVTIICPKQKLKIITEKKDDNRILECAVAAKADFLITGDKKHILPLKQINACQIISARSFIRRIKD